MQVIPISLKTANSFIQSVHRHHSPVRGCKFCIGLEEEGELIAIAVAARPVARLLDDGKTIEITRLCSNGAKNGCSMLYAAAWRAAKSMGYKRAITYILSSEPGTSLKAAGWKCVSKEAGGGSWNRSGRKREDKHPLETKQRWEVSAN